MPLLRDHCRQHGTECSCAVCQLLNYCCCCCWLAGLCCCRDAARQIGLAGRKSISTAGRKGQAVALLLRNSGATLFQVTGGVSSSMCWVELLPKDYCCHAASCASVGVHTASKLTLITIPSTQPRPQRCSANARAEHTMLVCCSVLLSSAGMSATLSLLHTT